MQMPLKRGQVTLFGILAMVILIIAAAYMILNSETRNSSESVFDRGKDSKSVVEAYVQSCVESVTKDAIKIVSSHGGYANPDRAVSLEVASSYAIPYYSDSGLDRMPTTQVVEREVGFFIEENLPVCLDRLDSLISTGVEIDVPEPDVTVDVFDENVKVNVQMEVIGFQEGLEFKIDEFSYFARSPLGKLLRVAKNLTAEQVDDPEHLCISCMVDQGYSNGVFIETAMADNDSIVFTLIDNVTEEFLIYANKYQTYSCDNLPAVANQYFLQRCLDRKIAQAGYVFSVGEVPTLTVRVGERFQHRIDVEGKNVSFKVYPALFSINESGDIDTIPTEAQKGTNEMFVLATDVIGKREVRKFSYVVI